MSWSFDKKSQKRALALMLSACFLFASVGTPALAADDEEEQTELKRTDLDAVHDGEKTEEPPIKENPGTKLEGNAEQNVPFSEGTSKDTDDADNGYKASDPEAKVDDKTPEADGKKRTPFELGIRKSVMDGGIDEKNSPNPPLQSGTAQIERPSWPLGSNVNNTQIKGGTNTSTLNGGLTQEQLDRLARHDLVLIIDQSSSMHTQDCPVPGLGRVGGTVMGMLLGSAASVSRWNWCRDQTQHLAEATQGGSTKNLSVVLFSGTYAIFPKVTMDQVPNIFRTASPHGGTNLTDPLRATIADYFKRKQYTRGNVKPLAIAIITDGLPNNEQTVCKALVEATYFMRDPREIKVTFFLIGNSAYNGQAFVNELERNLGHYGGRYNLVKSVSFWNLTKTGLARALADALE